jgi:hypothetical protein
VLGRRAEEGWLVLGVKTNEFSNPFNRAEALGRLLDFSRAF